MGNKKNRKDQVEEELRKVKGTLTSHIVDSVYEQVQKKNELKDIIGPGLYKQHNPIVSPVIIRIIYLSSHSSTFFNPFCPLNILKYFFFWDLQVLFIYLHFYPYFFILFVLLIFFYSILLRVIYLSSLSSTFLYPFCALNI